MRRLGSVQQKMPCVFLTDLKEEKSRKRDDQSFQVMATETLNPEALEANIDCSFATEKLDGTCCYVAPHAGKPCLWARLDRKPTKQAEKRFKKHQYSQKNCKGFTWHVPEDFKIVPETWIPAHGVQHHNGHQVPDVHGHIPGWIPVEKSNKQYCWHSSVVNDEACMALVLRPCCDGEDLLEITSIPLADLQEQTLELIGTNINGNPYGLGNKKQPIHFLVPHGSIPIRDPPPVDFQMLSLWFQESSDRQIEGIVWHCNDSTLFKVHRHHLGLCWPDGRARLSERPVVVHIDDQTNSYNNSSTVFAAFSRLNGCRFSRLQDVEIEL